MFTRLIRRCLIGLCFALPLGILAAATVQAQTLEQESPQNGCDECHEIIQAHWRDSAHAQSVIDPIFVQAWEEQGRPNACLACHTTGFDPATGSYETESVACVICHNPIPSNHPEDIMPTDISSRMCGECHLDTYAEWEGSVHGQENLACVRCHSPHSTDLRAEGVQTLCQSCHNDEAHFYSYTGHAGEGLLCADCHLRVSETQMGDGHGQRHHTFLVDMETCAKCHAESMHYPTVAAASIDLSPPAADEIAIPMEMPPLMMAPDPVSPYGFAVVAALLGMGFGIVLAPWLENWYRRIR
ncbi:MAG: hypothetical protein GY803_28100 [Chloroflexi bacterium]|nr:hypothetical protein [Chloroflexota bacterium]